MTRISNASKIAVASLFLSFITIAILAFGPKQTACPALTLSDDKIIGRDTTGYVFSTPNVAARRAAQQALTDRMCAKGYPGPGGKADCAAAKKLRATMPKTNTEWGISPGGQLISG